MNKEYQPGYVRHKHVKVHRWLWCWQEQTHFLTLSESFIAQHVFLLYTFSIKVVPAKSYIMNNQISHLFSTCGSFVLTLGDVFSGDNVSHCWWGNVICRISHQWIILCISSRSYLLCVSIIKQKCIIIRSPRGEKFCIYRANCKTNDNPDYPKQNPASNCRTRLVIE